MIAISKAVSLLAISLVLGVSGSQVLAKTSAPHPAQASGTSVSSVGGSGAGTDVSKRGGGYGCGHHCPIPPRPGHTQPTCKGPHRGPNGVMIQCD
jgi:hypothetical protein